MLEHIIKEVEIWIMKLALLCVQLFFAKNVPISISFKIFFGASNNQLLWRTNLEKSHFQHSLNSMGFCSMANDHHAITLCIFVRKSWQLFFLITTSLGQFQCNFCFYHYVLKCIKVGSCASNYLKISQKSAFDFSAWPWCAMSDRLWNQQFLCIRVDPFYISVHIKLFIEIRSKLKFREKCNFRLKFQCYC